MCEDRARCTRIDHQRKLCAVNQHACLEMAVRELVENDGLAPLRIGHAERTAGHEAGGDAAGDILQFVAILVAGDEDEDDQEP